MNTCMVLQMYLAMANVHSDIPANQQKISDGAQYLQDECKKEQEKKPAKKVEKKVD